MSEIPTREQVTTLSAKVLLWEEDGKRFLAHDAALRTRVAEPEAMVALDNAVCLCGCPASEHEGYGEDGEQCEHEDHECIRVAPAVLEIVTRLRAAAREAREERDRLREVLVNVMRYPGIRQYMGSLISDRADAALAPAPGEVKP